jgi:hypothetical protein
MTHPWDKDRDMTRPIDVEMTTLSQWHPNQPLFDKRKASFFTSPYSLDFRYHLEEDSADFHWPQFTWDDEGQRVVQMGDCPYKHTLKIGDVIVVHVGSCFALMPDDMRWSRDQLLSAPSDAVSLCRLVMIMYHDWEEYSYIVECFEFGCSGNERECYYPHVSGVLHSIFPGDVVINVRYRKQQNAACVIQRAWRSWTRKRKSAALLIEEYVLPWLYRVGGAYYSEACGRFTLSSSRVKASAPKPVNMANP